MANADCSGRKKEYLKTFLKALGDAARKAATALYHKLGQLLGLLAQAMLAQLKPVFALEKMVVESSVIFPLNVVKSALSGLSNISLPTNSLADKDCETDKKSISSVKKRESWLKGVSNKYSTWADTSTKRLKEMDEEIQGWETTLTGLAKALQSV